VVIDVLTVGLEVGLSSQSSPLHTVRDVLGGGRRVVIDVLIVGLDVGLSSQSSPLHTVRDVLGGGRRVVVDELIVGGLRVVELGGGPLVVSPMCEDVTVWKLEVEWLEGRVVVRIVVEDAGPVTCVTLVDTLLGSDVDLVV